jgi:hypothetical protein
MSIVIKQLGLVLVAVAIPSVASAQVHGVELPKAVLDISSLQLNSLKGDIFAFQFYRNDLQEVSEDRWWLSSGKRPCAVTFIKSRLPLVFNFDDESFVLTPQEILRQSPTSPWGYSIDGHLVLTGQTKSPVNGRSFVAIDLLASLDQLEQKTGTEVRIKNESEILSWHFDYDKNWSYEIQLRTPNDALKLGTALRRWHVQSPGVAFGISALTVDSAFDVLSADSEFHLNAKQVEQMPELKTEQLLDGGSRSVDGYRAFTALSPVSATDHFLEKKEHIAAIRRLELETLPEGRFIVSRNWISDFCELCRQLRVYASHSQRVEDLPLDDPGVRWSRIEQLQGARLFYATEFILPKYLQAPMFSIADRIQLIDARADLGESQFLQPSRVFNAEHGDLYRSILNAHHQHPYSDADIKLCREYLEKIPETSPASHCLIESLILMGEIEKLPPDLVDRWYSDEMFSGTRADQLEVLRQVTLVVSGRQWLRNRVQSLSELSDTDRLAVIALKQRATATRTTARWDFMSELECDTTMTLVEKLERLP